MRRPHMPTVDFALTATAAHERMRRLRCGLRGEGGFDGGGFKGV